MKFAIAACLAFAATVFSLGPAAAGDWEWGCLGPMGDEQILFSRDTLIIAPAKPALGKLEELYRIVDLGEKFPDADAYSADQYNDGFLKTMTYTGMTNPKSRLTLTELSTKQITHRHHLICGRDEDTTVERKVYRVERPHAAPIQVTLQCREYLLTTRGGRPCISD